MKMLSLFTGMGGFDIGLERAGFETVGCVEQNPTCRLTLSENFPRWKLTTNGNILDLPPHRAARELGIYKDELALIAGGPPCQPFSKSGFWHTGSTARMKDPRAQTIVAYFDYVEYFRPDCFILENVGGIKTPGKSNPIYYINKRIRCLQEKLGLAYKIACFEIDCADYGVPQHRKRMFIVGNVFGENVILPNPTHGLETKPFVNAWSAFAGLPKPTTKDLEEVRASGKWADLLQSIPEGNNYLWLSERGGGRTLFEWRSRYWNFLLKLSKRLPSWTIQATPGPATGPFHWENRKLTRRELCRLQTIPDTVDVQGTYMEAHRQIGNAVPSAIGELFGKSILQSIYSKEVPQKLDLITKRIYSPPGPDRTRPIKPQYII